MRLKRKILKQIIHRNVFSKKYNQTQIFLFLLKNKKLKEHFRNVLQLYCLKQLKKTRITPINNYCLFTSSYRSVYAQFKLRRNILKKFQNQGKIPGLYKR
jgi:ribosomal protein S14